MMVRSFSPCNDMLISHRYHSTIEYRNQEVNLCLISHRVHFLHITSSIDVPL